MNGLPTDPVLNLYTPQALSPEHLLAEFVDRKGLLARILDILRQNTPDRPQQHMILLGPRGMGKTTLLCAIRHAVNRDADLATAWLPLQFAEEQYNIGDLADFWLECLRHLEQAAGDGAGSAYRLLDENPADLAERARERFYELLAGTGKRALLLVDNLNEIFAAIDDGRALHQLRALWMTDPRMTVIGAAPSHFEEIAAVDQAFHDFFRTFSLERLNQEELETCLRRYAEILKDDTVPRVIEQTPERVAALRILTGGNPRLVKLGYRILREGLDGDLRRDLENLLDAATPFFKHRIDHLAKEARRVFDAIARRWDPVTVDDIRRELRKPSNYVSAQIKRLIDDGYIEETGGDKKKRYQVGERFYNVYYLWRMNREGRKRLRWLVGFMQTFYSRKDYQNWAKRLESELAGPLEPALRADKLAHLHALCDAADGESRAEVFDALVRDAIAHDDRRALGEEAAEGDPIERLGCRFPLAELLWLLDRDTRQALGYQPTQSDWWQKLADRLKESEAMGQAETRLDELGAWRTDTPQHAYAAGVLHMRLFDRVADAEAAYRKILEIEPQDASAWYNLGIALYDQGLYPDAEAAYRKVLDIDPRDTSTWRNLGLALQKQGHYTDAEAAYRKVMEIDPRDPSALCDLGATLIQQGRYPDAEATYRKKLEIDPKDTFAWFLLGMAMSLQGRHTDAEAANRKALEIDPQDANALFHRGYILVIDMDRPAVGLEHLLAGLALKPDSIFGLYVLSRCWQAALPVAVGKIAANEAGSENLGTALTVVLIAEASAGSRVAVRNALLALDETGQALFEPLLLALQALDDKSVLYRIASEKRDLVLDVMKQIGGATA